MIGVTLQSDLYAGAVACRLATLVEVDGISVDTDGGCSDTV
jgi:hypothetical protein